MRWRAWRALTPACLASLLSVPALAEPAVARAALVIDDLGYSLARGERAVSLPVDATYGILPYTPFGRRLAEQAHQAGKEVILHLPMSPEGDERSGPGTLTVRFAARDVQAHLLDALATVPHAAGVSNHMGSRATREPALMRPLMRAIDRLGGYFLDSRTTSLTVACHTAAELGVPTLERDVFIDADRSQSAMRYQWQRWQRVAARQGSAVAIAHPHPETLDFLERMLAGPADPAIALVPVSELLLHRPEDKHPCRPYSFPSPKVARKSKPSP
jgi:polysaccharide deacetylase 2 family uncharacterized protein YibQ